MNTDRPLDGVASIKVKLALLVAASITVAALVSEIGDRADVPAWLTLPVTIAAALGVTQWLARGMTSPLRHMTDAAASMATGDYSARVRASSADEVGRLAAAFNTMAADLATADHQRRQLVATVSHELRTPLAAQQALLENLVDGVVRPDDQVLGAALAQAQRLGDLVEDLLDLSRIDGGRGRLDLEPVEVRTLVERCVAETQVAGHSVRHEVVVQPEDLVVDADPARLAQVLANLLDNAVRHSPAGGAIRVCAERTDAERWTLEVEDDGPGIPADRAEHAFDRFGSWDNTGGGTGIGLAIASWVCALHGGSITSLPPRPGQTGARVRAVLPIHPQPINVQPIHPQPPGRSIHPTEEPAMPIATPASTPASTPDAGPVAGPVSAPPRPLVDAVFGDLWPESGLTPQIGMLLASAGIGVLAAATLPYRNLGVAVLVVLLAAGALVVRASPRRARPWTVVSAVVCVALSSLVVLRAAGWLAVLAVVVAGLLVTTALTGARGILAVVAGPVAWVLAALRGLPLLGRTISATSRITVLWPVVRTAAISLVALVVFGGLFASGDAVFGSWAGSLVPDIDWDSFVLRAFVAFVVGGTVLAATYLALNPPRVERLVPPESRPVTRAWEWVAPVAVVLAVFLAFVVAQAAALFGGHDYVQRTTGLSYAEYVHQGFGQLTAATVLTLATVALAVRKAPRSTSRDRLVLRALLGTLGVLTLVVVASALHRMDLYQQAYGFTVLRVLVDVFELWLGLLVVLVLVAGVRLSGGWLPRAALLTGAVILLVLGLANPEAWVAQRNIDRYAETGRIDVRYLRSLGDDATPTIVAGLPGDLAACVLAGSTPAPRDDLLGWNLGRSRAADASAQSDLRRTTGGPDCPAVLSRLPAG